MVDNVYDAIVIGSGITGGWAAKELTEKGLKVLMLERGRDHAHIKDYVNASKDPWEWPLRGQRTREMIEKYPVLKRDYPLNEQVVDMWANEQDNPYIEEKRFDWYRAYQMGGRSILWGRQSYRFNKWDFEANAKEGIAVDWPIRYDELAPWYSYVEKFAGIQGSKEGLEVLPDGEFLPAIDLNIVEKDIAGKLKKAFNGSRHLFIGRSANITEPKPEQNRVNCQYRNKCWLGCPFGAYFSTQSSTLPAAKATGNLTVEVNKIVRRLIYDKDSKRATGVEVIDAENNQTYDYKAKIIFVCASAFNSTWILMNSATDIWPEGLGSSSGELGHNVMDHHFRIGGSGPVEGFEEYIEYGRRPSGFYIPRFRNIYNDKRDYLRGFGYQGSAYRGRMQGPAELFGEELKVMMTSYDKWSIGMTAFGEMLPYHDNTIKLDKQKKDKWGMPVLSINVEIKENEIKMRKDMLEDTREMLEKVGIKTFWPWDGGYAPGMGIHEMGTARMGRDPKTSVLNGFNQVWDAPNVYVTDGACMTSSSCVNPSLTYMAITARAADHAVNELKKMNL